jgi:uncharacterized protein (DUF1330 family)
VAKARAGVAKGMVRKAAERPANEPGESSYGESEDIASRGTVVLEFPSMEHAKRWHESPAYRSIVKHRFKAATSNVILAAGYEAPTR